MLPACATCKLLSFSSLASRLYCDMQNKCSFRSESDRVETSRMAELWRLADTGKEIQLLRTVRTFSTNNHKRSKRMACYFPFRVFYLPFSPQFDSGRLRSAQLGSDALAHEVIVPETPACEIKKQILEPCVLCNRFRNFWDFKTLKDTAVPTPQMRGPKSLASGRRLLATCRLRNFHFCSFWGNFENFKVHETTKMPGAQTLASRRRLNSRYR